MSYFAFSGSAAKRFSIPIPPEEVPEPPPPGGYQDVVTGLAGGGPVAYWRMSSISAIEDSIGSLDGTFAGAGQSLASSLPEQSNEAVDFGGAASASVPNNAAFDLAEFTLSFWFKANGVPNAGERWALVCRDDSGDITGDFVTMIEDDASLTIGFQVTGLPREIIDPPTIQTGTTYHLAVRADNAGFDAFLNGVLIGDNTDFTDAWSDNVNPIRFAGVPWRPETANVVLDEVALYPRVVTQAEVLALAQLSGVAPVAVGDAINVLETVTTAIDVLANDSFAGTPTIEVVNNDGGRAVAAGTVVNYTAPTVGADEARSFTYRITDPGGTSNTATVNVTVLDDDTPAPAIANCYTESDTNPIVITASAGNLANLGAALASAITTAGATGRNILIAEGVYTGGTATLNPQGTAANPVVVRTQGGLGSVTVNNATWTVADGSSRLVLSRLYFNSGHIQLNGTNHRVTRCRFRQVGRTGLVSSTANFGYCVAVRNGDFMRIDHCDMSDWQDIVDWKGFVTFYLPDFRAGLHHDVLVDYNYLHDYTDTEPAKNPSNAFNTSSGGAWNKDFSVEFSNNLIRNAPILRDKEFVTCKFSGVVFKFNTFENVDGYLQQRQGGGWEVRSNWFENMGSTSPLKCFDDFGAGDQSGAGRALVIGNRLVGALDMWIGSGNSATVGPNFYHASREGRYIGNIVGGAIRVGFNYDGATSVVRATDNNLWNNQVGGAGVVQNAFGGNLVANFHQGTTFDEDNEAYVIAMKIPVPTGNPATDLVGLVAADPLCPSGPQS